MARTKTKKAVSNHAPQVPALIAKEPSPLPKRLEGHSPSPEPLPLTQSGPNVPLGTAAQLKQTLHPGAELRRTQEEPGSDEVIVRSQEPLDPPSVRTVEEQRCHQDTSSPRLDLQTNLPNIELEETTLALLHSLKNETSRRVQPARYRPVGASDATTEGVDSSIIEAAEKARTVTPIIPLGTKIMLYNGPAKEGEKEVRWELSAGQRAGYYGEKNGEGEEEDIPATEFWEIEGWDALAEGEDEDVRDEQGSTLVVTNGATPNLSMNAPPGPNTIGGFDFSDATYINRHKKYAVVEKRHRLREQEMVQWELSKLPAKISQLRALDVNVFKGETLEEKEQYRTDMLVAAETLEKRYAAIKNVATARKENRPIDPAGHMNYLTSWHQPAVPNPAAEEGDPEAAFVLPLTRKRKRYEFEDDRDAEISVFEWDEEEEFITGIGSRAPVDYAYAPGHYPSNRKKVRKDDRKKLVALNGAAPLPKKNKTKNKKNKPPPKLAIPPPSTFADESSVAPTEPTSVPPRPPPKLKAQVHAPAKAKVPSPVLKKADTSLLAIVAKRLAEGRREGREGGIPFGAPFPTGGFILPYAGYHGEFQLPRSLAPQATESIGSVEAANTEMDAEETVPQEMEPEDLEEGAVGDEVGGAVKEEQVPAPSRPPEAVIFATPANVLEYYDDEPLTELSSDDGKAEPDDQDEQRSTPANEDADGEGEEEDENTGEEETVEGPEDEDEDTDSFRPEKSVRQ